MYTSIQYIRRLEKKLLTAEMLVFTYGVHVCVRSDTETEASKIRIDERQLFFVYIARKNRMQN